MTRLFQRLLDAQIKERLLVEAPAETENPPVTAQLLEPAEAPTPHIRDFLGRIERPQGEMGWARKTSALRALVLTTQYW